MTTSTPIHSSKPRLRIPIATGLAIATALLAAAAPAFTAEATEAMMEGRIMDQTGAFVSGVKVTLIGGTTRQVTSDKEGKFKISIPEGFYVVTAEKPGFVAYAEPNIEITAGTPVVRDIKLELSRTEAVTVQERADALSLGASENAGALVLRESDIDALPDDPDELADYLQALAGNSGGPNGGQIFIDGFTGGRIPNKASIKEIRLNANPFSAEYDRMGHGRIQIITRPGTDKFRGGASFRFNNDALNTRNPYAPNKPPYQREDYGFEFAGPISNGKASFAIDGDYQTVDGNQTITANILDNNLAPTPFAETVTRPQNRLSYSPRIDWQISDGQSLTIRYSHRENEAVGVGIGGFNLKTRGYDTTSFDNNADLTHNAIVGKAVNDIRLRFGKTGSDQTSQNPAPTLQVRDAFTSGGAAVGISTNNGSRFELADIVSWATQSHAFRAGFRVRRDTTDEDSRNNFAGVVTFAGGSGPALDQNFNPILEADGTTSTVALTSLERYQRTLVLQARGLSPASIRALGGGASQYTVSGGNPAASVAQTDAGFFINDDWKKSDRLVLGLGLRGELQTNLKTRLDLAPRASFAYSLVMNKDGKTPKTITRGGIGVFYDRVNDNLVLDANRYLGIGHLSYVVSDPALLDTIKIANGEVISVPTVETLNRFSLPQNTRVLDDDIRAPRSIQASLSLEQQTSKVTGTISLIASRGDHQLRSRNINAPGADGTRPLSLPGAVYAYETTGKSRQLQVVAGLSSRPGQRNSFFLRYFLGWTNSDTDGASSFPAIPTNIEAEYSRASSDTRHRMFAGGNINGPWGIRIGPMLVLSTGRPYNITSGLDYNHDGLFSDRPSFGTAGQDGVIETEYGPLNTTGIGQIIPRNYGEGPGFASLSLRISKSIAFRKTPDDAAGPGGGPMGMGGGGHGGRGGRMGGRGGFGGGGPGLTFTLSVSNVLDHKNEGTPNGNLLSPNFGQSTSLAGFFGRGGGGNAAGNRRIELQMRANF